MATPAARSSAYITELLLMLIKVTASRPGPKSWDHHHGDKVYFSDGVS